MKNIKVIDLDELLDGCSDSVVGSTTEELDNKVSYGDATMTLLSKKEFQAIVSHPELADALPDDAYIKTLNKQ